MTAATSESPRRVAPALTDATNHFHDNEEESDLQQEQQLGIKRHSKACTDVYHYTRTTKNGLCLVVCGYRFTKSRRNGRSETYWRCAIRRCSATAKTSANGLLLSVLHVHSHGVGIGKVVKHRSAQVQPPKQSSPSKLVFADEKKGSIGVGPHSVKSLLSLSDGCSSRSSSNQIVDMLTEVDENVANISSSSTCANIWRSDEAYESDVSRSRMSVAAAEAANDTTTQQYSPQVASRHWLSLPDVWQFKSEVQSEADHQTRPEVPECSARPNGQIPAFISSYTPFSQMRPSLSPMLFNNRGLGPPPNVVPSSIISGAARMHNHQLTVTQSPPNQIQPVNLTKPCRRSNSNTAESTRQAEQKNVCGTESIDLEASEWIRVRTKATSVLTTSLDNAIEQLRNADSVETSLRTAQLVHQVTKSLHILRTTPLSYCANCTKLICISSDPCDTLKRI